MKLIFTIDLDAFFTSCEELKNPNFKKIPIVTGNDLNGRGVVSAANYKARSYGIHSGLPLFKAKKIYENLVILPVDMQFYQEKSHQVFSIVYEYSKIMEIASVDECYVDLTHLTKTRKPLEIASIIKNRVYKETGLTISIGISTNILLSKIASNMDKPNGITTLYPHEIENKLWPLKLKKMYMLGNSTEKLFNKFDLKTIGDLASLNKNGEVYNKLKQMMGINLDKNISKAHGFDNRELLTNSHIIKSISRERTLGVSQTEIFMIRKEMRIVFDQLYKKLIRQGWSTSTVSIILKKDKSFKKMTIQKSFKHSNDKTFLWNVIEIMLEKIFKRGHSIKQVGVHFSHLKKMERTYSQLTLDQEEKENDHKLLDIINDIEENTNSKILIGREFKK